MLPSRRQLKLLAIWNAVKELRVKIAIALGTERLKGESKWFQVPVDGYGEVENYGPFRLADLTKFIIITQQLHMSGRLVPAKVVNRFDDVCGRTDRAVNTIYPFKRRSRNRNQREL